MSPRNESFSANRRPSFNDPTKPTFDVKTEQTASRTPSPTNVCMTDAEELPPQQPQRKKGMLSNLRASISLPKRRRSLEKEGCKGSLHLSMERSGSSSLNLSRHSAAAEAHLRESNHGSDAEEEDVVSSNSTSVTASSTPNSSVRSSRANLGRLASYSKRNKAQYSNHSFHHTGYMDNMRSASPAIDEEVPLPSNSEHNESLTELTDQLYASSVSNHLRSSITESITEEGNNVEDEGECGDDSSRRRASSFASDDVSNDLDKRYQDSEALLESLGESPSEADLTKVTTARVSEIVREQSMEDRVRFANIPRFTKSDVLIGRHLGKGCFSDVFEVTVTLENDQSRIGEGTSLELNNRIRAKFGNSVGAASKPSPFDYNPVNTKSPLPPVFKVGGGSSHCSGKSDQSSDDLDKFIDANFGGGASSDDEEDLDKFIDANFGGGDVDRSASAPPDDEEDLDTLIDAKFGGGYVDRSASAPPPGPHLDKFSDCRRSSDPETIHEYAEEKADVGTDFKPAQLPRPSSRQRRVTTDLSSSVCVGSMSAARRTMGRSRRLNLAMKCLRPICRSDAQKFMIGVEDLVHETVILSSIDHPNIIKIHGRAELGEGYFILLDKLKDTLEDRIEGWRKMFPQSSGNPPSINQVKVARTLADTVAFLHDRNIVFHDLKPPNVGFDERGQLKLFDFGFAVEVTDDEPLEDKAGTVRYMSPEVGLDLGHGLPSDVYSFSILLWEIFSLKKPFAKIKSPNEFKRIVFDGGERPKLGKNWSVEMKEEIERGWSDKPNQRPSMDDFAKLLSKWQHECPARAKTHNDKSLRGSIVRMKSRMSWDA